MYWKSRWLNYSRWRKTSRKLKMMPHGHGWTPGHSLMSLKKLQTDLANEKGQASKSNTVILELESQLENTRISIRSRKEEVKIRETINQINQSSDKLREEMEQLKLETDEERRARSKLELVLRLRKQTLQTLQLTLRATRIESEAFAASSSKALHHVSCSQTDNGTVQLTQEEYNVLTRRAQEETSLADWRVSLAMEQRLLAEKNRELAFRSLQVKYKDSRSRKKKIKDEINAMKILQDRKMIQGSRWETKSIADTTLSLKPKPNKSLRVNGIHNSSKAQKVITKEQQCRKRNHPFLFK